VRLAGEAALVNECGKMERANGFEPSTCTLARIAGKLQHTQNQELAGYWFTIKGPDDGIK
jgi:hypothetical protein